MTTTIFLARFFGFFMSALGLFWMFRREDVAAVFKALFQNRALMVQSGIVATAGGLAVVVGYNTWTGWEIVISLIGAWILFQGLMRLFYPGIVEWLTPDFKGRAPSIVGLLAFGVGVFLFLMGYFFG